VTGADIFGGAAVAEPSPAGTPSASLAPSKEPAPTPSNNSTPPGTPSGTATPPVTPTNSFTPAETQTRTSTPSFSPLPSYSAGGSLRAQQPTRVRDGPLAFVRLCLRFDGWWRASQDGAASPPKR